MQLRALSEVKPGDYIKRTESAKKTYVKGAYDRATRSFSCTDTDDISREIFIKAVKLVYIGFTY